MLKSDRKKFVFKEFDKAFLTIGYEGIKTGGDPTYIMKSNEIVVSFFMNFKDLGSVSISSIRISIEIVENLIIEVLGEDFIKANFFFDRKKYFLSTVVDRAFKNTYEYRELNSEGDLREFTNWYISYIKKEGKEFLDRYSYIPNILVRMDELTSINKTWQNQENGILSGALDAQFRGLIISKLCGDKNYKAKIEMCDKIFFNEGDSEWKSHYKKLKERIKDIKPQYDI